MSYQGYKNYETWVTRLWADNEEGTYDYIRELASEYKHSESKLADVLKDHHEEWLLGENCTGLKADLLQHALQLVDWYQWALDLIEEIGEEEEEED